MCKIIAIANQKGGVAKTTTTINLGVGLSKVGKRVMLIDADPQGHLTMGLGFPKNLRVTLKTMMENIIMGLEFDPREAILHHEEGIDVIPSNKLLSGMDMSLFTVEDREKVLKEYLELLENDYDYILIDCMPSLGMMTINALSAADSVLIPVQPQYYAADGLMELLKVVKGIHQRFNPDLQIEGILFTMDSSHYNNSKRNKQAVRDAYGAEIIIFDQTSNTDLINLSDSSEQQSMDLMEEMELFQMNTALVKRNIEYDCLVQRCRLGEQQQLDEIVALIVETISIERENITISGVKYPYQFVKSRLLLLEESHIEYVLDCLHENTREVKNIKAYLLTCLMNSITTIGNYYQAKVNHDMYGGGI